MNSGKLVVLTSSITFAIVCLSSTAAFAQSKVYGFDLRTRENLVTFTVDDPSDIQTIEKNYDPFALDFDDTGTLYALNSDTDTIGTIDLTTGAWTAGPQVTGGATGSTGMAFDITSGAFFACSPSELFTLDVETGVSTMIAAFSGTDPNSNPIIGVIDMTIASDGTMYCFDLGNDSIWIVDKTNGCATWVAASDVGNANFAQGMDFDPDSNALYQAIYTGGGTGSYGYWDLSGTPTWNEIATLQSFPDSIEMEIALYNGTTYGYNFRGGGSLISFPKDDTSGYQVIIRDYSTFAMDFNSSGELWIFNNVNNTIGTVDDQTGCYSQVTSLGGDFPNGTDAAGLSFDDSIGMFFISTSSELFLLDEFSGTATAVGSFLDTSGNPLTSMIDIAVNSAGDMYGFDTDSDTLFGIDKTTAVCTPVGTFNSGDAGLAQGMDFDPATGILWAAIYIDDGIGSYGSWDITTGEFTELLPLENFPDTIGTGYQFALAIQPSFGGACGPPSGFVRFRGQDVGNPVLSDFESQDGVFASYNPGFTLNSTEAPVWLIFDFSFSSSGSFEITSQAGTPGLEYRLEYSVNSINYVEFGNSTSESFGVFTTEVFSIPSNVSTDRIRVGWRKVGFTINFPWQVDIDSVLMCE